MATRSQQFRSAQERSGPKRAKSPPPKRRDVEVDTSLPGVSATDRKFGLFSTATRNVSIRAQRKAGVALEESSNGRPSRKSTRSGENHLKPDNNLKRAATRKIQSPESRAARASAASVKARGKTR